MADAIEWLRPKIANFGSLTQDDVKAITDFALIWSFFEGIALDNHANCREICKNVDSWVCRNVEYDFMRPALQYFKDRYYKEGRLTDNYYGLNLKGGDWIDIVQGVMTGHYSDNSTSLKACLIIVYRYRNNLFHGVKWNSNVIDQIRGLYLSGQLLMSTMDKFFLY